MISYVSSKIKYGWRVIDDVVVNQLLFNIYFLPQKRYTSIGKHLYDKKQDTTRWIISAGRLAKNITKFEYHLYKIDVAFESYFDLITGYYKHKVNKLQRGT